MPYDHAAILDSYLAAWNETDDARRAALVRTVFTDEVTYTDPIAEVTGHDALSALIGAAQQQFAGLAFTAGGLLDGHHEIARFAWHLGAPGSAVEPVVIGFDVVRLAADGRIAEVLGFLDRVPQG